jgi:predicted dehydrogenase
MAKFRVAIVGMGGIGNTHARCYQADGRAEVVAVCDVIEAKARAAASRYGCRAFPSVAELLASGIQIDAASVATAGAENGADHHAPTMELLGAGVPVLGEKPISNDIRQAREMVACARERKIPYAINLNHRFTPAARRAREWLEGGRLGALSMVNMTMWINNPNESSEHFHMRALHPHSIDVMRYFAGEVAGVHAFFRKGQGRQIWSNVQMNIRFENGVIGHLTGSYDAGPGFGLETCELIGSEGRAIIHEACEKLVFTPRAAREREEYEYLGGMRSFAETFLSRISAWLDDLERATPPEQMDGSAADALAAQLVIEAAIRSFAEGRVVSPTEVP